MATADTQASRLQTAVSAARLRAETVPGVVGMLAVVGVLTFVYRTFSPLVEPLVLRLWLATMLLCPLGFALSVLARLYRRPDDTEVVRRWQPTGLAIAGLLDLSAIAGIWVLLPAADPPLLLLMVVVYVWFLATQMMVSSPIARLSLIGPIGIPVSLMIQLLRGDVPHGEPLAIIVACIGLTLFALGRLIARAKTQLQAARLLSDQAAVTLGETLARVAAERDAKTRFIAAASHDLQQPLQSASLFFEAAIAAGDAAGDAAARHRAIAGTRQAFAATSALIAQMLDYLRLEAGVVRPRLEAVALRPLIAGVVFEHEPAARAAGMRLVAVPGHRQVVADQALLRRVLGNFVDNAIRHARGERVLIGARQRGSLVTLWVIDDGNGVAPADAGRLFDDFAQGSDHGSYDGGAIRGGFGLGLASARRSMTLMAGTAGHDRRWTGGAAFYVTLPAAAPAIEAICKAA